MVTIMLNALSQTTRLGGSTSTGVYDDGELEGLLGKAASEAPREDRGTQFLSPEMLARVLAGETISPNLRSAGRESQP
ncbi:MAG TPA: hypothetical protein PLK30_26540 [Blastocatellia bacterium]|nr:hypothetical protein [Blastocatellia bacterium]